VTSSKVQIHQGPLPSAEELASYDVTVPGAAERIISMAENQAKHRQGLEAYAIRAENQRSWGGLVAGLIVAVAFLAGAVILGIEGQPLLGGILGTLDLGSIVGTFVYGTRSRRDERQAKL